MIAVLLWLLATIDAAFIGYRAAAGRSALINKKDYYRRAMLQGAVFGQIAVLITGLALLISISFSEQPQSLIDELQQVGRRMLIVYIPFALIIFLAFALRSLPSVDIKSITSTVIFGPFTLLRPLVAVGGVIYGLTFAPKPLIFLLCGLVIIMMLGLEWFLSRMKKSG